MLSLMYALFVLMYVTFYSAVLPVSRQTSSFLHLTLVFLTRPHSFLCLCRWHKNRVVTGTLLAWSIMPSYLNCLSSAAASRCGDVIRPEELRSSFSIRPISWSTDMPCDEEEMRWSDSRDDRLRLTRSVSYGFFRRGIRRSYSLIMYRPD